MEAFRSLSDMVSQFIGPKYDMQMYFMIVSGK
jgi:hypothetical protein